MTKAAAVYQFWNGFGLEAFEENTVPDDAEFPYITYQFVTDAFGGEVQTAASLWYRSETWLEINAKAEEISKYIGRGGKMLRCDDGAIWIKRGQPFAQNMSDETDKLVKRKYLNTVFEYETLD